MAKNNKRRCRSKSFTEQFVSLKTRLIGFNTFEIYLMDPVINSIMFWISLKEKLC